MADFLSPDERKNFSHKQESLVQDKKVLKEGARQQGREAKEKALEFDQTVKSGPRTGSAGKLCPACHKFVHTRKCKCGMVIK